MAKDHGPTIKNDEKYEALRNQGYSEQKAARIANAKHINYNSTSYETRSKKELYEQAKKAKIEGRSKMNKKELIYALRHN